MLPASEGISVSGARRLIADMFRKEGIDSPELDARLLIGHALGLDHAKLAAEGARILSKPEIDAINTLAARRLRREPVARIVGRKEFWSLPLRVSPDTLVPRPETETVVEAALAAIDGIHSRAEPLRIVDLGTGTGAILLALLSELPKATGIGTDINPRTLDVARDNAHALDLQNQSAFVLSDFGAALTERFDLIVSNPPYIATTDIPALAAEVRDYDPHLALDGGADGLACYRRLAADAEKLLKPGGLMVVEIGTGQSEAVRGLFEAARLEAKAPPQKDLAGIPRSLVFRALS